ncbi:unnamed protein product [Arabidopsis lyrata]|nr:unnamed protein product [Arabidopsis lyrata]
MWSRRNFCSSRNVNESMTGEGSSMTVVQKGINAGFSLFVYGFGAYLVRDCMKMNKRRREWEKAEEERKRKAHDLAFSVFNN